MSLGQHRPTPEPMRPQTLAVRSAMWLAPLVPLLSPLAASAGDDAARLRTVVDAAVRPLMARHDIPGMAVALTVDGQSQVFSYGVSSKESQAPVTASTVFEVGSISKMFAATLAALAQANGQLSLDEHPGRYLPRLQGRPIDRATLLELGTYTAGGLPLQFPDGIEDDEAAFAYFEAWQADAAPGTVRRYSNPSIGLLGAVTAAALKDGYAHLIETQLLPPFGMQHTHITLPPQAMADYAWGYRGDQALRVNPGPLDAPAYGIKSTAADMIRFVQANIDPSGLEPPLRRAVELTQVGQFQVRGMVQGLGWEQFPYPTSREALLDGNSASISYNANPVQRLPVAQAATPRLFDKTGSTNGFGAYVAFVPSQRIGLVLLANRNFPIPARIEAASAILDQLAAGRR